MRRLSTVLKYVECLYHFLRHSLLVLTELHQITIAVQRSYTRFYAKAYDNVLGCSTSKLSRSFECRVTSHDHCTQTCHLTLSVGHRFASTAIYKWDLLCQNFI